MATTSDRNITWTPAERIREAGGVRRGIVIGISRYRDDKISNLSAAASDAKAIHALMIDPDCGTFDAKHVQCLLDEDADYRSVKKAFSRLVRESGPKDDVWIYFAGHGIPSEESPGRGPGNTIWAVHDTEMEYAEATGITPLTLQGHVKKLKANARRVITFLDCCHAEVADPETARSLGMDTAQLLQDFDGEGQFTVCSSKAHQVAREDDDHGVFTRCLIEGLSGAADLNHDGIVDTSELWRYLQKEVPRAAKKLGYDQKPVHTSVEDGVLPLTYNPTRKRMADRIRGMMGLGRDDLTTDEAKLALAVLDSSSRTREEDVVNTLLPRLCDGTLPIKDFKVALEAILAPRRPPPPPPSTASDSRYASLRVRSRSPGVHVVIDGGSWTGTTPVDFTKVPWGEHHVLASLGDQEHDESFVIDAFVHPLQINLASAPPAETLDRIALATRNHQVFLAKDILEEMLTEHPDSAELLDLRTEITSSLRQVEELEEQVQEAFAAGEAKEAGDWLDELEALCTDHPGLPAHRRHLAEMQEATRVSFQKVRDLIGRGSLDEASEALAAIDTDSSTVGDELREEITAKGALLTRTVEELERHAAAASFVRGARLIKRRAHEFTGNETFQTTLRDFERRATEHGKEKRRSVPTAMFAVALLTQLGFAATFFLLHRFGLDGKWNKGVLTIAFISVVAGVGFSSLAWFAIKSARLPELSIPTSIFGALGTTAGIFYIGFGFEGDFTFWPILVSLLVGLPIGALTGFFLHSSMDSHDPRGPMVLLSVFGLFIGFGLIHVYAFDGEVSAWSIIAGIVVGIVLALVNGVVWGALDKSVFERKSWLLLSVPIVLGGYLGSPFLAGAAARVLSFDEAVTDLMLITTSTSMGMVLAGLLTLPALWLVGKDVVQVGKGLLLVLVLSVVLGGAQSSIYQHERRSGETLWKLACTHSIELMKKHPGMADVPRDQLDKALEGAAAECLDEFKKVSGENADKAARCVLKLDRFDPKEFSECEPKKMTSDE
ncbi:MAG: caspase family protein [Pseudomonadota bacterium]